MAMPQVSESQIGQMAGFVRSYIEEQRQKYSGAAAPLTAEQRTQMAPFFPASVLEAVRVNVLQGERVGNPGLYMMLKMMGFKNLPDFESMAAITFVDVIVSHVPVTSRLLFHELVHAVQFQAMGVREFSTRYIAGFLSGGSYEAIPLEAHAYELDQRYAAAPEIHFAVQDAVQSWISQSLY